uniref:BREX-1 system phosphatase PglZ type A n=1 Tax=Gemmatimonas sp. TaxID=1962908 RepID=UPI003563E6E0
TEVERLFGYTDAQPSVRDFAVRLFRGANPLDNTVSLHAHGKVFMQRWKDSQASCESYRTLANQLEGDLQLREALGTTPDMNRIGEHDTFELFEKAALHHLASSFTDGAPAEELRAILALRRTSFWRAAHAHGYDAIEQAIALRELMAKADLTVESIDDGLRRYTQTWWRIDTAYRRCMYHLRQYHQVALMEPIKEWVELHYINDFLLPLADRWSDQVKALPKWSCNELPPQRRFFDTWVEPFRSRGQKVFVIISDALRYEAAADFAERLTSANRWSAEVEASFGSLPSFTQLGMASLLPGQSLTLDVGGTVAVDGQSASGADNRGQILASACGGRATAIKSDEFLTLNSKAEGRELMHAHDVIFIYHNTIDHIGDKPGTEVRTTEAVAQAFEELDSIIRKVANINGTNMLLTADHGFLFQQNRLDDGDMTGLPAATEWPTRGRRFSLGRDVSPATGVKLFSPESLGVQGDWTAAFPLGLGRFPLQGSGKLYVHGGVSLQEIVIPVVKIHKKRVNDTGTVEVDLLNVPTKITTGRLSVTLFQHQPAVGKMLPRTLRIGVYGKDSSSISEQRTLTFDSAIEEARLREQAVMLVLSAAADKMNNQDVQLRLEELVQGTSTQWVTYRAHTLRLQKPFTSDFDDL